MVPYTSTKAPLMETVKEFFMKVFTVKRHISSEGHWEYLEGHLITDQMSSYATLLMPLHAVHFSHFWALAKCSVQKRNR